jgi:gliding motility-associated-like protein
MKRLLLILFSVAIVFTTSLAVQAQYNQTVTNGTSTTPVNFTSGCNYTWTNSNPSIGLAASGTGNIAAFNAVNTGSTPVTATITATPVSAGLAYISAFGSGGVTTINTATGTTAGGFSTNSPYGTAISPDGSKIYITDAADNYVTVFKPNGQYLASVTVGNNPNYIVLTPDGKMAYVANTADNTVSVFDAVNYRLITTIPVGIYPTGIAVTPDGKKVYVTNRTSGTVSVITTSDNTVKSTIFVGSGPAGIAASPDGSKVYVANYGDGTVSVINVAFDNVQTTFHVGNGPFALALNASGSLLYESNAADKTLTVYNTATNALVATVQIGGIPAGISVGADNKIYVAGETLNKLLVIDATSYTITNSINVGNDPFSLGNFIYTQASQTCATVTFTITVNPSVTATPPVITETGALASITTVQGTASASGQFSVSATGLTSGVLITPPPGFEVSTDNVNFSSTVTAGGSGTLASAPVYIRLAAADVMGSYTGSIVLSSAGATSVNVAASGTVTDMSSTLNPPTGANPPSAPANQTVANGQTVNGVTFGNTCAYSWFNDSPSIGLPLNGTGDIASFTAVNTGTLPIVAHITATPAETNYAYIANRMTNNVTVIDVTTQTPIATIPLGNQPIAVTTSTDGLRVYVSSYGDNKVYIIDTKTNTVEPQAITVGNAPYEMVLSPDGSKLYVANSASNTVSVVNTVTNTVAATIAINQLPAAASPYGIAISGDGSKVYVANYGNSSVSVINTATNNVISTITVGNSPHDVLVSHDGKTVFVTNFSSQTLSVINVAGNNVTATVQFDAGPNGMALSPDGSTLFITLTFEDAVQMVGAISHTPMGKIMLTPGAEPLGIAFTKDGSKVYVVNQRAPVTVINGSTQQVAGTIDDGSAPVNGSSGSVSFGNFMSATSCAPVTFTVTVNPASAPTISASGTFAALTTVQGTPSPATQFNVQGSSLNAGILVTPPTGFEVSTDNVNFSSTLTIGMGGIVASTPVYIRLAAADAAGTYSGNVAVTSPGAAEVDLPTLNSTVTATTLAAIIVSPVTGSITAAMGTVSVDPNLQQFTVSGTNLTGGIHVLSPPMFEVSLSPGSGFGSSLDIPLNNGAVANTVVYVSSSATAGLGVSAGGVMLTSPGALSQNAAVTETITSAAAPAITFTGILSALGTVYGTASTSTIFNVSGTNLTGPVTITPPAGFEVSTDDVTFKPAINVNITGTNPVQIFVRLSATAPAGVYSHNIVLTSPGAPSVNVPTAGSIVNPAVLTITADSKIKVAGQDNPPLTITYSGFVNHEDAGNLTAPVVIATTAVTSSPVGEYPITVTGAEDFNYTFNYIQGVLDVLPVPPQIVAPNAFTPNNDGVNDTWDIKNIENFPRSVVDIFNRWGKMVYSSIGYSVPWDGRYKGTNLPTDVYYYVINPNDGGKVISGSVTIIR